MGGRPIICAMKKVLKDIFKIFVGYILYVLLTTSMPIIVMSAFETKKPVVIRKDKKYTYVKKYHAFNKDSFIVKIPIEKNADN